MASINSFRPESDVRTPRNPSPRKEATHSRAVLKGYV